jgi:hypothetical protein
MQLNKVDQHPLQVDGQLWGGPEGANLGFGSAGDVPIGGCSCHGCSPCVLSLPPGTQTRPNLDIYTQTGTIPEKDLFPFRHPLELTPFPVSLSPGVSSLGRKQFRSATACNTATAASDLAFPEVEGRRTALMRVTNRLVDSVLTACESDAVVGTQFFRVTGLLDPPTRLLHPSFLCRVASVNLRRAQRHSRRRQVAVANVGDGGSALPEMQWE